MKGAYDVLDHPLKDTVLGRWLEYREQFFLSQAGGLKDSLPSGGEVLPIEARY